MLIPMSTRRPSRWPGPRPWHRSLAAVLALVLVPAAGCAGGGSGGAAGGRAATATTATAATTTRPAVPPAPVPVGQVELTVTDTGRSIPAGGQDPGAPARVLPVLVLYPAQRDGPHTPGRRDGAPYPLVVFSHGFTGDGPAYTPFLRRLAAWGYVVAAPTFPRTSRGAPGGPRLADYVNQPRDVRVVIDALARSARPGRAARAGGAVTLDGDTTPLAGLLDTDRVAVAGHSLGGATTIGVAFHTCCRDRRVRAAIPIAPVRLPFPDGTFERRDLPVLFIHGDRDPILRYQISVDLYGAAAPPKALLTLIGAGHTPFGPPWSDPMLDALRAFLDTFVRDDPDAPARLRQAEVAGVTTLETDGIQAR